jgi:hypothetical protein
MELVDRPDDQEKFSRRCSNGRCARKHSRMFVKTGSIFEKTKVPLAKWLHVQITGQLADCRSVHGFKSSFVFVPVRLDVLGVYAGTWVDKI